MNIKRELIEYQYENKTYSHHILLAETDNKTLLSPVNIYLKLHASRSLKTSERYSSAIKRFIDYLITQKSQDCIDYNIWRTAKMEDIRKWQGRLVSQRDLEGLKKPSDKTILESAKIVYHFYCWASDSDFPVIINNTSKEWKYNFKHESKIVQIKSMISGTSPDHANIDLGGKTTRNAPSSKKTLIMSDDDISALMTEYKDPVYSALLMLALATGLREQGCVSMPFIGVGVNSHIRPYPEIKNELKNGETAKTFNFTVKEKGNKVRTLQVNMAAWKTICNSYLPLFYERKKLFKKQFPGENSNAHFFLKKNGEPVTAKNIADQTYLAKQNFDAFPWSFHSARDWYATNFIIRHLTLNQINNLHYDAAVEEQLRLQLGHNDIKTTYMHYVRQASLILALQNGQLDYTLGKDEGFFNSLI
ncbi:conserved hypothetical protein [Paraglaciecola sp. T6c]|uniref:site-specific integrase n=1 Tax=Pseudoalteromonas atlantica (strain T6c / ATCC BAA-1087) TaxID=3042615 RepID=UPI00005C55F0|nr:site-specific integrase [Paraglaciecola sp. T6c]ABG40538.1 conserved hypothetical protein [Paraglaciecola sp. T6c]